MRGYYPGESEDRERPRSALSRRSRRAAGDVAPGGAVAIGAEAPKKKGGGSRIDWFVGILVGIVLGIGVVVAFLAFGSEGTIDAPKIHGVDNGGQAPQSRPLEPVKE